MAFDTKRESCIICGSKGIKKFGSQIQYVCIDKIMFNLELCQIKYLGYICHTCLMYKSEFSICKAFAKCVKKINPLELTCYNIYLTLTKIQYLTTMYCNTYIYYQVSHKLIESPLEYTTKDIILSNFYTKLMNCMYFKYDILAKKRYLAIQKIKKHAYIPGGLICKILEKRYNKHGTYDIMY
jgi:hypothetical protein